MWFLRPPWHCVQGCSQSIPASLWGFLPLILPILCYTILTGLLTLLTLLCSWFHQGCPSTRPSNSSGSSSGRSSDVENPSLPALHEAGSTLFYCYLIPCCPHMVNFRLMEDKKLVFSIIYLILPYCLCFHIFNSQESAWCIKVYHTL